MVETSYFWEGLITGDAVLAPYSTDRYHANWQTLFTEADDEGVISDYLNELEVTGISQGFAMDTGAALVDGTFYRNDTRISVGIDLPITDPRIDRVILRKDWGTQTVRRARIEGVENPAPTPPALTQTEGAIWEIPLAQLLITVAGAITVTDEREFAETPLGPGGGLFHLETFVSDGSLTQFDFSEIPPTFRHLMLECVTRHTHVGAVSETLSLRFNGDAGNNYDLEFLGGVAGAPIAAAVPNQNEIWVGRLPAALASANLASQSTIHIANYTGNLYKTGISNSVTIPTLGVGGFWQIEIRGLLWRNTDLIDRITLFNFDDPAGAFVAGSTVSLYGIR